MSMGRDRRPRLVLHPLRMLGMSLPYRVLRLPGWGLSPGWRLLVRWGWWTLRVRWADTDRMRYIIWTIGRRQ